MSIVIDSVNRVQKNHFRAFYSIFQFGFLKTMAGGEPIPENPLIGSEDHELALVNENTTRITQKQAAVCPESTTTTSTTTVEKTTEMAAESYLEDSVVLVILAEDQEAIKNFWATSEGMEDDKREGTAVEITLPEPQEEASEGSTAAAQETPAEAVAVAEASVPAPPAENPTPETQEEPAPNPPENPVEQVAAPAPAPPPPRNKVPFRKSCVTCSNHEWRQRCWAMACLACGDSFVLMYEDEKDNEEVRATIEEEERPACNPGDDETAYCKSCLIDWFDNCIAWPHREALPKMGGTPMLPLLEPFVSVGYTQHLKKIQGYWDDKEKLFCPVPTCSTYIPRELYMITKEEEVKKPVVPVEEKKEDTPEKALEATESAAENTTEEQNTETVAESSTQATAEPTSEVTAAPASEVTAEPAPEAPVETTNETTTEVANEPSAEEKKEESTPEPVPEFTTEIVKKELKSQLAICPSPECRAAICTLCKSHFHGLDTPCVSHFAFVKEFLLEKFANPNKESNGEENKEGENDDGAYDEDDGYEEYPNRFRQCVNCKNLVARHTGCDHMTCACGYAFCFYCGGDYGEYHSCITDEEYDKGGALVGGIKITNEDGFLDVGAHVMVNTVGMVEKEEDAVKVKTLLDVVELTEGEETKKVWKVKVESVTGLENEVEDLFSEEERVRLAKPMKAWKGR
ncbi:hypothetical protein AA313_de0205918 [Arthrobotrys entomopaga]|nr:hypothetical protein AA313_de0205918 [Arthrobotrys entomopaga]